MRLLGRFAGRGEDANSPPESGESGPEARPAESVGEEPEPEPSVDPSGASSAPDYAELGERVAGVLASADEAARQVRVEVEEEAAAIRQQAEADAASQMQEIAEYRTEIEGVAKRTLAKAEADASATRAAAEQEARDMEEAARQRQSELREETRSLAEQRQQALLEVRNIASHLQDVILKAPLPRAEESPAEARGSNSGDAATRELTVSTGGEESSAPPAHEAHEEELLEPDGIEDPDEHRDRLRSSYVGTDSSAPRGETGSEGDTDVRVR